MVQCGERGRVAHFDLFVLGAGSGGVACARRAGAYGARVAIAESGRVGGTCVLRGCVPKKLMRYAAHFPDHFRAAEAYGWRVGAPRHDWDGLIEARNRELDRLHGIYVGMLERAGVAIFRGRARVLDRGVVEVNEERHTADRILIAVGARPDLPDLPGIEHAITSDDALEGPSPRPQRVAVVGGGYIGIEMASILHGLGIETTLIVRRDAPLRGFDSDVRTALVEELRAHGLPIWTGTSVAAIEKVGNRLVIETSRGPHEVDAVLYATGRRPIPNTGGIGLEALGVRMEANGAICVDAAYQSSVPGVLAVGDCSDHAGSGIDAGAFDLTPVAVAEGRVIAETHFNANPHTVEYASIPTAVFSIPEAGAVGLTEELARARGHDVQIFRTSFRPLLHTLTHAPVTIMMKLVVDKSTDRVLGCHMVGDDAAEIIQGFAVALSAGATKAQFDATVGLHPSAAEEFVTMYQPVA
jgi:glutathione reductase (NADPH)